MSWMMPAAFIASSLFGADAASSAASTQAGAADRAAQLQKEQFDRQVELQAPFREGGLAAQNRLMELLGISGRAPATGGGGGGILGGVAGMVANAVQNSGAANSGLNIDPNSPDYGKYARDFGMDQFQQDPGYAFRLSEGQKALDRSAAARGGLISGGALKAAQRYGQDMGSQEYTNAFNRYQTERNARLNPLQSLAGVGQTSTNALGVAGQNYATGAGEAIGQAAQARASGYVGGANALSQGLGSYMNYNQNQQRNAMLERALGRGNSYGNVPRPTNYDAYDFQ